MKYFEFVYLCIYITIILSLFCFPPALNGDIVHLCDTTALGGHLLEDFRTKSLNPHGVVIVVFD